MTRRYYRMGTIDDLHTFDADGHAVAVAMCMLDGVRIHVVSTHVDADDLGGAAKAIARIIDDFDDSVDVFVDLYLWRATPPTDRDDFAHELERIVDATMPEQVRQVVIALSSPSGGAGMSGVHHVTFRRGSDGYEEDPLYRSLHPMMGKRLELWRLQNFALEVVPSVEDVYAFRGTAHDNASDVRLFVMAEVRDMTAVRDGSGKVVALPELERMYMEALNVIRSVQSRLPTGHRLQWNRVLLYVWPPIDLLPDDIDALVQRLAPSVKGLGLEKVVVRGRIRRGTGDELDPAVLEISSPDGTSVVSEVRMSHDMPLEPLTAYTQKVVQLRRRGLMYPYELVRMLAPAESVIGSGIPHGSFVELDLDGDRLVEVDRPPGSNRGQHRGRVGLQRHAPLPRGHATGDPARRSQPRHGLAGRARVPEDHGRDGPGAGSSGCRWNGSPCPRVHSSPWTAARRTWTGSPRSCGGSSTSPRPVPS